MKPILATKLYIAPSGATISPRPRLLELLEEGLQRKLTLISAPPGYGKTTLIGELVAASEQPIVVLSLDGGDNDPASFLAYLVAAFQRLGVQIGEHVLSPLQSPQRPTYSVIVHHLLNDLFEARDDLVVVLDDLHLIHSEEVLALLESILEHLPPTIHFVIAAREDPPLPLPKWRARGQLSELRDLELRFSPAEATALLNDIMGLALSESDVAKLESRTEGWVAGLLLAALSLREQSDVGAFLESFAGGHHYIAEYLVEEVLHKQPLHIQRFLLQTSVLDQLCGSLCDAVLAEPALRGQEVLEELQHANMFIVPLDAEHRWYRYHHLFGELLQARLRKQRAAPENGLQSVAQLHFRACKWYESQGLELEAFRHAAAAGEVDHAARLIGGRGIPLYVRGALFPVLEWLGGLAPEQLDERPMLWAMYAGALFAAGQTTHVEEKIQAAEAAMEALGEGHGDPGLLGHIAGLRATLALTRYMPEVVLEQADLALKHLSAEKLPLRVLALWQRGIANEFMGNRREAGSAYEEARSLSRRVGHIFVEKLASIGVGHMYEVQNRLHRAHETYHHVLALVGNARSPELGEVHRGLAYILYQWNDVEGARRHAEESLELSCSYDRGIDRYILSEIFLARLVVAEGDPGQAVLLLNECMQTVHRNKFDHRVVEVAEALVFALLRQGDLNAALRLAQAHEIPLSLARAHWAAGNATNAIAILEKVITEAESRAWADVELKARTLQALVRRACGEEEAAFETLSHVLKQAEPEGFIRLFLDEGPAMQELLARLTQRGRGSEYTTKLLVAFGAEGRATQRRPSGPLAPDDPLSSREVEVLQLIAQGLSNRQICERLFLALPTVKGHNQKIFGKLGVSRRTEAVARARQLGLL